MRNNDKHHKFKHKRKRKDLANVTDNRNFLLIFTPFRKHAEVKHPSSTIVKFDNNICIVNNVRYLDINKRKFWIQETWAWYSSLYQAKNFSHTVTFPSYISSLWLTSMAPEAIIRTGFAPANSLIKSKKWQHFSTRVPPVLELNRFQLLTYYKHKVNEIYGENDCKSWVANFTLTRKGNRCSRIATILTCPRVPPFTISINFATGGMYLYSNPTCTSISGLFLAAFTT